MEKYLVTGNENRYNLKDLYLQARMEYPEKEGCFAWGTSHTSLFEELDEKAIYLIRESEETIQERIDIVINKARWYLDNNVWPDEEQTKEAMIAKAYKVRYELCPPKGEVIKRFDSWDEYNEFFKNMDRELWIEHVDRMNSKKPMEYDIDPDCEELWNQFHEEYNKYAEDRHADYMRRHMGQPWHFLGVYDAYGKPLDDKVYMRTNEFAGCNKNDDEWEKDGFSFVKDEYLTKYWGEERGYYERHDVPLEEASSILKDWLKYNTKAEYFVCSEKLARNKTFQERHLSVSINNHDRRAGFGKLAFRCAYCGRKFESPIYVTIDYVDKESDITENDELKNIVYCCHKCNCIKGNNKSNQWQRRARIGKIEWLWPFRKLEKVIEPLLIIVGAFILNTFVKNLIQ